MMHQRLANFADYTTIHGVRDLIKADKRWKRTFWALSLIGCTVFFVWDVNKQVERMMKGRKSVIMNTLASNYTYAFPPVIFGVPDWIWISKRKLNQYNITYEQLAVAKSFLAPYQHYHSNVPVEMAESELRQKIELMNATGTRKLFSAFAHDDPPGLVRVSDQNGSTVENRMFFKEVCFYTLNTSAAQKDMFGSFHVIHFKFNVSQYMEAATDHILLEGNGKVRQLKYTNFDNIAPSLQTAHFHGHFYISPGKYYTIYYDIQLYRRLLKHCTSDIDGGTPWYSKELCEYACERRANLSLNVNTCFEGNFNMQHYTTGAWPLCSNGLSINESVKAYGREHPAYRDLSDQEINQRNQHIRNCSEHQCLAPCLEWLTTASMISSNLQGALGKRELMNQTILIEINYPSGSTIIVMQEVQNFFWYDLVSNIGGLFGLCLGASLMSLMQFFHLCQCNEKKNEQERNSPVEEIQVNVGTNSDFVAIDMYSVL